MRWLWEVDAHNQVTAERRLFRVTVAVNGAEVFRSWKLPKQDVPIRLADGRSGFVKFRVESLISLRADLTIEGQRQIATDALTPKNCAKCGASIQPNTRYCERCGSSLLTADDVDRLRRIKEAGTVIRVIAVMFAISGVVMFFVQRAGSAEALENLATAADTEVWPVPVNGNLYTVAELRQQIQFEIWSVLVCST